MQENNGDKGSKLSDLYTYRLKREQRAGTVAVGYGDLEILRMYKHLREKPIVAVLHDMIVTAVKCWEEQHNRKIKEMEEKIATDARIIIRYIEKFDRVRPR